MDIGSTCVKGVRVGRTPAGFKLIRFATVAVSPAADKSERLRAIQGVMHSLGTEVNVVTAVGGAGAVLRNVLLPKMTPAELRGALSYEADKYIPFKPEEANLDFAILGDRSGGRMEVVLAAARKELVQSHLEFLKEAQVTPFVVDLETLALNNAWEVSHSAQGSEVVALVHMGARATTLVFFQGLQFEFSREIPIGGEALTQAIAQGLQLDALEAEKIKCEPQGRESQIQGILLPIWEKWFSQARTSFDFYEDQYSRRIEKLLLAGPSAHVSGFREWLETTAEIPTDVWDPLTGLAVEGDHPGLESAKAGLAVAVGLAVREAEKNSPRHRRGGH